MESTASSSGDFLVVAELKKRESGVHTMLFLRQVLPSLHLGNGLHMPSTLVYILHVYAAYYIDLKRKKLNVLP